MFVLTQVLTMAEFTREWKSIRYMVMNNKAILSCFSHNQSNHMKGMTIDEITVGLESLMYYFVTDLELQMYFGY